MQLLIAQMFFDAVNPQVPQQACIWIKPQEHVSQPSIPHPAVQYGTAYDETIKYRATFHAVVSHRNKHRDIGYPWPTLIIINTER